jgi:hypothetical protein
MNNQQVIYYKFGRYLKFALTHDSRTHILECVLGLIFGFIFWWLLIGNPIYEFEMITNSKTADGFITDTKEVQHDDEKPYILNLYSYEYQIPDGRKFQGETEEDFKGQIEDEIQILDKPYPIKIEYLPYNPAISRIKGTGTTTIFKWLFRIVFKSLLPCIILYFSIFQLIKEICSIKNSEINKKYNAED